MSQTEILLESGTNELEIVEFFIDEDRPELDPPLYRGYYGINVAKVLEIIRSPELTEMPDISHRAVLGAFNLRNEIIPLIDLARWLGKDRVASGQPKVIVTEFNKVRSSFLVSGVTRIHRINWGEVEAPTDYVSSLTVNSITGVVKLKKRIVFILDMEKITADLNPDAALPTAPPAEVKEEIEKRELKAVIADDSTMARNIVKEILVKAGFQVHATVNGEQAWNHLEELRRRAEIDNLHITNYVDIVVSDIEMPIMDGHNLTKRIKDDHVLRDVPVILCSSIITEALQHKGEAVGADDQISKAELGDLVNKVYALMNP